MMTLDKFMLGSVHKHGQKIATVNRHATEFIFTNRDRR
jgi:hypothetical protein